MNRPEETSIRYYVQWDTHARHMGMVLCSMMEHQSLVDLAICCGTNTIHAHKCIIAANSPYFREQLEKNPCTEQVVFTGLDFVILKSIIEFMYCGETSVSNENLKFMIAAAKFFQMRGLQTLVSESEDIRFEADSIQIPAPVFLPKKPKYPNAFRPINNPLAPVPFNTYKNATSNDPYFHRKVKRKFVRSEAEKACAKEAAASRLALEALRKELASTSQMSSFVIEESCTETTVENFIPRSDETFIDNLNQIDSVPLHVVNYEEVSTTILDSNEMIEEKTDECSNMLQYTVSNSNTKDKLKQILGEDIPDNVEIMFRTSDGNFVTVTDDVLQNLSNGTLQYQLIDENGHVGAVRDLQISEQNFGISSLQDPLNQQTSNNVGALISVTNSESLSIIDDQNCLKNNAENLQLLSPKVENEIVTLNKDNTETEPYQVENEGSHLQEKIVISSSSSCSSIEEEGIKKISPMRKTDNTNSFISTRENFRIDDNITFNSCDVTQYLNMPNLKPDSVSNEMNENIQEINDDNLNEGSTYNSDIAIDYKEVLSSTNHTNLQTNLDPANLYISKNYPGNKNYTFNTTDEFIQENNESSMNNIPLSFNQENAMEDKIEQAVKYTANKPSSFNIPCVETEVPWQMFEDVGSVGFYPAKRRRPSLKSVENIDDEIESNMKSNKVRRLMANRKKK